MRFPRNLPSLVVTLVIAVCCLCVGSGSARAESAAPGWELTTSNAPTNLPPGGEGIIGIHVYNIGAQSSSGMVTVTDELPEGLEATEANFAGGLGGELTSSVWGCSIEGTGNKTNRIVTCTRTTPVPPGNIVLPPGEKGEERTIRPDRLGIRVKVKSGPARRETNVVRIAGGGALLPVSVSQAVVVSSALPGFGFASFDGWLSNRDGTIDTQAGSHPYETTINFQMNAYRGNPNFERNIEVNTPPGIVGNPTAIPQCPRAMFDHLTCPASTQIGLDRPELTGVEAGALGLSYPLAVYNLVPPKGIPAQFGFTLIGVNTFLDAGVRTGSDNGITEHIDNLLDRETDPITGNSITLWGEPSDPSHDPERLIECVAGGITCYFGASSTVEPVPLLTLPTSCGTPPRFTIEANSWQEPGTIVKNEFVMHDSVEEPVGFTGCEKLVHFGPEVSIAPDTTYSDTPAGLGVELRVPPDTNPEGLASSGLKDTTVVLPEGVAINPGQATGLQACQSSEENIGGGEAAREEEEGPASCPAASKVGTDEIEHHC